MCNLCCLGLLSTSSVYSCMVGVQSNAMFVSLDFKLYTWNVKESSKSLEICIFEIFYDMIWFAPWWFLTLVNQQSRPKTEKNSTTFYADFKKVSKKFLTTVTKYSVMKIKKEVYLEIFSNIFFVTVTYFVLFFMYWEKKLEWFKKISKFCFKIFWKSVTITKKSVTY